MAYSFLPRFFLFAWYLSLRCHAASSVKSLPCVLGVIKSPNPSTTSSAALTMVSATVPMEFCARGVSFSREIEERLGGTS